MFKTWLRLAVVTALVGASVATGGSTIDQSQWTTSGTNVTVSTSRWVAQTFVAGASGDLDRVDLNLWRLGHAGELVVEIRTASGGTPSNTVLGSVDVPETAIGDEGFAWSSIALDPGARVTAGGEYAIVLHAEATDGTVDGFYVWNVTFGNPYTPGRLVLSGSGGTSWGDFAEVFDDGDAAFATYVSPALPRSKAECMDGGWRNFPGFESQGDCVSFVVTGGRNEPSG